MASCMRLSSRRNDGRVRCGKKVGEGSARKNKATMTAPPPHTPLGTWTRDPLVNEFIGTASFEDPASSLGNFSNWILGCETRNWETLA